MCSLTCVVVFSFIVTSTYGFVAEGKLFKIHDEDEFIFEDKRIRDY